MNYLEDSHVNIACLQETWLRSGDTSVYEIFKDFGYKTLRKERSGARGGGLAILFHPDLKIKRFFARPAKPYETFEYLCCKFTWEDKLIRLVNLYRLPYSAKHRCTMSMFFEEFELFIADILTGKGHILLCGDFNIDWKAKNNVNCEKFSNILKIYNLKQLVNQPTHVKGGLLDLIIVDEKLYKENPAVETDVTFQTDHHPIVLKLTSDWHLKKNETVFRSVRELHKFDMEKFLDDLNPEPITKLAFFSSLGISEAIALYNSTLARLLDKQCPLTTKRYKLKHWKSRWYNPELKELKKKKRRSERALKKHPSVENTQKLKCLRNEYNFKLKEARENFYHQQLTHNNKDSKQLFSVLKKLTGTVKEKIIPTSKSKVDTAEDMAVFYTKKISKIRQVITNELQNGQESYKTILPITGARLDENSFNMFSMININELKKILSEMKNKSSRADPISTSIVQGSIDLLAPILLHIINSALKQQCFPEELKKALITPIIKNEMKNPEDFQNYRPVSNLEFLSKLLERVMYVQLVKYIEKHDLHGRFQSAYKPHHSCETAMVHVVDDIQQILKSKMNVCLVMLDLSSAFDTVDHELLLDRLERQFFIREGALKLIKSYLYKRTFAVVVDGYTGTQHDLEYGVPQGSILGPLFYLLYTREIEAVVQQHGFHVHLYADDCTLYFSYKDDEAVEAKVKLSLCVKSIKAWMRKSFLKLNTEKTTIMLFKPNGKCVETSSLCLNDGGKIVHAENTAKLLGVVIGPSLNFSEFATKKIQTCNFHLSNLRAIKKSIPQNIRILLVTNLICSTLDYCNSLLICSPKYVIDRLQVTLNDAVRFIFDVRRREHISPYLYKLHILPVLYRIKFKVSLIAFKVMNGMAPLYLTDKAPTFQPRCDKPKRQGCGRDEFMFDCNLSLMKSKTWLSKMVCEWNLLPLALRLSKNIEQFKSRLKAHYFELAFEKFVD